MSYRPSDMSRSSHVLDHVEKAQRMVPAQQIYPLAVSRVEHDQGFNVDVALSPRAPRPLFETASPSAVPSWSGHLRTTPPSRPPYILENTSVQLDYDRSQLKTLRCVFPKFQNHLWNLTAALTTLDTAGDRYADALCSPDGENVTDLIQLV